MRKRSKYRPKRNLLNPVGFVLESFTPVREHSSFMVDLKIKNHGAVASLMRGQGTRDDVDTLINMANVTEALYRLGFGQDYGEIIADALQSIRTLARRGVERGSFVMRAEEIKAINDLLELHDAQLEVIVLKDMERAIELVNKEYEARRMTTILTTTD